MNQIFTQSGEFSSISFQRLRHPHNDGLPLRNLLNNPCGQLDLAPETMFEAMACDRSQPTIESKFRPDSPIVSGRSS